MFRWINDLFFKAQPLYKKDDSLLPEYEEQHEEDEDEEEDEEENETNSEAVLVKTVFEAAGGVPGVVKELNMYFDMFSTLERVIANQEPILVWWMSRNHPYARILMAHRARIWREERKVILSPFRVYPPNVYGFTEDVVEMAVTFCTDLCKKYELIKEEVIEEETTKREETPVVVPQ